MRPLLALLLITSGPAAAQTTPRVRFDQPGDVTFAANSIMTCRVGSVSGGTQCATARASAADNHDDNDYPMVPIDQDNGTLPAGESAMTFDSSSADLILPAGATVTWAGLYWQCITGGGAGGMYMTAPNAAQRDRVLFRTPAGSYATTTGTVRETGLIFMGFADVTSTVQASGPGTYWVGNVQCDSGATNHYGGWALVVVIRDDTQPLRDLAVFDFWQTYNATAIDIDINGFVTPPTGSVSTRVGLVVFDGDRGTNDSLTLISPLPVTAASRMTLLGDPPGPAAINPNNNIGNSTVTRLGANVTTRAPAFINNLGFDADYIATVDALPNSSTSARIHAVTAGEVIEIGVATFATDIFAPDIDLRKTVSDVNGGSLMTGDELLYTITGTNNGMDPALDVIVRDAMPTGTMYVPGSLTIAGTSVTDAAGDDTGEFDAIGNSIVARAGTGATAVSGGRMNTGATTTITFRVRVTAMAGGEPITNTAIATYTGLTLGSGTVFTGDSDGDTVMPGTQPTVITTGPLCGDGRITMPGETCDDGNTSGGDGCSGQCRREVIIGSPDGVTLTTNPPPIVGSADPGATVMVSIDGMGVGSATADAAGIWMLTPATSLGQGIHTIAANATDTTGGMSSDTATFTIDTQTFVMIVSPSGSTNDTTPTIAGTGEPGAMITVSVDMGVIGTVTVAADGTWSIDVPTPLAEGTHMIEADARDALGNTASAMSSFDVDLSTTVALLAPADGSTTSSATPAISGTGEPGSTIDVTVDGTNVGSATVASDGTWSLTPSMPLSNGMHTAVASATDRAGNTAMDTSTFTVMAGTFVTIDSPADGSRTGSRPMISGRGEPGAMVAVSVDGTAIGTATVAADGTWSIATTSSLTDGAHTASATATNGSGEMATATSSFTVDGSTRVDYRQPGDNGPIGSTRPELSGTAEPGDSVEVTLDGSVIGTVTADAEGNWTLLVPSDLANGAHSVSVRATDSGGNTATDSGSFTVDTAFPTLEIRSPADQSHTGDTTPPITGDTDPGAMVIVLIDGAMIGTATADALGHWHLDLAMALATGMHTVVAQTTNAAGNTATDSHQFTIDSAAPAVDLIAPADGSSTRNTSPTISGTAAPGATVQVFVDGALIATVTAASDGTWSANVTGPLTDGTHTARAVASDGAGNTSTDSGSFTVDTATNVAITRPADGSTIGSPRPTIRGTSEPNSMVEVSIDGTVIGTATTAADGTWSIDATSDLSSGSHTASAHATDALGNTADASSTFTFDEAMLDTDGDGLLDTEECPTTPCRDSDGDGNPDFDDPDDDGDGVPTAIECTARPCMDGDSDGMPDYLDPDDDGDGIPTMEEAPGGMRRDTDMDGTPDYLDTDDDGDGLTTREETPGGVRRDTDSDGTPDFLDPDDDGDTIPTARERADGMRFGNDVDNDGSVDWLDTDSDGAMGGDQMEGVGDNDGDGVPNYLDPTDTPQTDGGMTDGGVHADGSIANDAGRDGGAGEGGPHMPGGFSGGACVCTSVGASRSSTLPLLALFVGLAFAFVRRSSRRRVSTFAIFIAVALATPTAHAQNGFALDQFRPAETSYDGFAISRPNDMGHLNFGARLAVDYAHDPLVYEERLGDMSTQSRSIIEHQLVATGIVSFGLFDRLVLYAGLPVSLFSAGDGGTGWPAADGTAVGDVLFGLRGRIWGEARDPFAIAVQATGTAPLGDTVQAAQSFTGERGFTFVPRLMMEVRAGDRFRIALNVGARIREESQLFNLTVGHELTAGLGLTLIAIPHVLDFVVEGYGATAFQHFFERESTPFEVIGGVRAHPICQMSIGFAAGTGISRGYGAPNFRGIFEIGYAYDSTCTPPPAPEEPPAPPADRDGDGTLDDTDLCTAEPEDRDGFQDDDGCPDPDNDSDGVLDVNDGAPMDPEDQDGFEDQDGVPDPDNDQDQVPDATDQAPNDPEDRDGFQDEDGAPDPDNDGDGVLDRIDPCPLEPGPADNDGCPRAVRLDTEHGEIVILQRVEFATGRDTILASSFPVLQEVSAVIQANPQILRIRVEGHTDDRGRDAANLELSRRRAASVRTWLVEHGIEASRIVSFGCGELHPLTPNRTRANRQANRRVEFHIIDPVPAGGAHEREGCVELEQ